MLASVDRGVDNARLVLIPSYNTGVKLLETVREALRHWPNVWVVIDGGTDGTAAALCQLPIRLIERARNGGKGAAVLAGLRAAAQAGFSHVLVMDADGQHPATLIPAFMAASRRQPAAMILGRPVFDRTAPRIRVVWRRLSNALARLETLGVAADTLFGFRIYPLAALKAVMEATSGMRRFDFDTEALVRLSWRGVPAIILPAPVRYFSAAEGGVSHFRYGRDNLVLAAMHTRLLYGFCARLPWLAAAKVRPCRR